MNVRCYYCPLPESEHGSGHEFAACVIEPFPLNGGEEGTLTVFRNGHISLKLDYAVLLEGDWNDPEAPGFRLCGSLGVAEGEGDRVRERVKEILLRGFPEAEALLDSVPQPSPREEVLLKAATSLAALLWSLTGLACLVLGSSYLWFDDPVPTGTLWVLVGFLYLRDRCR